MPIQDNEAWSSLRRTFDEVCDKILLPMRQAVECDARRVIDEAAALALGLDPLILGVWRETLSREPTITNQRAP